jgi:uncharacterized protein YjbI with pentapeptide repeats
MDEKCKYPGCELPPATGKQVCVFHAPKDEKGIALELFNDSVRNLQRRRHHNFEGFVFPGPISFRKHFEDNVTFKKALFYGHADFEGGQFDRNANFENAQFERGANFRSAKFKRAVTFDQARFTGAAEPGDARKVCFDGDGSEFGEEATFRAARFSGGFVVWDNASFNGRLAIFERSEFCECWVYFLNATFSCQFVDFTLTRFISSPASFTRCRFEGGGLSFASAEFNLGSVHFNSARFSGEGVTFEECKFTNANVTFTSAQFDCTNTNFNQASFTNCKVEFSLCRFTGGDVSFTETKFPNGHIDFSRARFSHDVRLRNNSMPKELRFVDTRFDERSGFYLIKPRFKRTSVETPRILFRRVRFNPFITFFEGIHDGDDYSGVPPTDRPIILFRYCQLKDVQFANNDMALFSFYSSSFFEEAHFISDQWIHRREAILNIFPFNLLKFSRANQIVEEQIFELTKKREAAGEDAAALKKKYSMDLLKSYSDVAEWYLRFKTAADRAKNYHLASWFYFHEFEMRRQNFRQRANEPQGWAKKLSIKSVFFLYTLYRVFAGYGEMPRWSLAWFSIFTTGFAVLHLFNGIRVPLSDGGSRLINYDWGGAVPNLVQLVGDFFYAVLYTLYRVIPVSYLPYRSAEFDLAAYGFWPLALSLANSVVLIFVIILIGVGVKRHFRRF